MKSFNVIIKEEREDRDWTQKQIAILLKTNQQKISRLEKGDFEPNLHDIISYCKIYNLSANYILGLSRIRIELPKE